MANTLRYVPIIYHYLPGNQILQPFNLLLVNLMFLDVFLSEKGL